MPEDTQIARIKDVIADFKAKELELKNEVAKLHKERTGTFEYAYGGAAYLQEYYTDGLIELLRKTVTAVDELTKEAMV